MDLLLTTAAALCAGISCTAVLCLIIGALSSIEFDKNAGEPLEIRKPIPVLIKIVLPLTGNLLPLMHAPLFQDSLRKTSNQLMMAGYDQTLSTERFLAARLLLLGLGVIVMILCGAAGKLLYGLILLAMFYVYPGAWLRNMVSKRHFSILRALPNLLDLLTLSVEAGKDFLSALKDILARRPVDALGEEFMRALQEIQLGKKRQTALRDMAQRTQQPELSAVLNAIVQADELGISIGGLLRIQSDQLRNKRFALAEKLAGEAPVKLLMPVVLFIFPAVFLLMLGPVILQAMKAMR